MPQGEHASARGDMCRIPTVNAPRFTVFAALFIATVLAGCARRPFVKETRQQEPSRLASLFPTESEVPYLLRPPAPKSVPPDMFPVYLGLRYGRYRSYNATEIMYISYYRAAPSPRLPVVDMEVIRFASSDDAFGVFSVERPVITEETGLYGRGYIGKIKAGFWYEDLYIRILTPTDEPSYVQWLRSVAEAALRHLPPESPLPSGFDRLPLALRIPNSEVFVRQRVLGYSFLTDGYLADYDFGGRMATAFVCLCETTEIAEERYQTLHDAVVGPYVRAAPMTGLGDRAFLVRGSRHGNIVIFQRNRFLAGLLAAPPAGLDFLRQFDSLLGDSP